jgi:hypothetical protein
LQQTDRTHDQRGKTQQPGDIVPDRSQHGGALHRDDHGSIGFPAIGNGARNIGTSDEKRLAKGGEPGLRDAIAWIDAYAA